MDHPPNFLRALPLEAKHVFAHLHFVHLLGVLEVGHDLAAVEHHQTVGELDDLVQVSGDQQHRRPCPRELHQLLADELRGAHVDASGGLVGDDQRRLGGELPGHHHLLDVAAGEHLHLLLGGLAEDLVFLHQPLALLVDGLHVEEGAVVELLLVEPVGDHVLLDAGGVRDAVDHPVLGDQGDAHVPELVLMEAIKTAYCPGFVQMVCIARSGIIGSIRDVESCFTRLIPPGTRETTDAAYGGAFTEYGSYTLLPMIKLLGKDFEDIRFESLFAENGVDMYTKAFLKFKNGFAMSKTGLGVKSEGQLLISGTQGYILAPSPWWLTKGFEVRYENPSKIDRYVSTFLGSGLRYELSDFVHCINGNENRAFKLTVGESIALARIMERFMQERARRNGGSQ